MWRFGNIRLPQFRIKESSISNGLFLCLAAFSVRIWLESGKIWKNNDHTCLIVSLIAFKLAGSLGKCLNTQSYGLMFKQLPQDLANVNA